MVPPRRITRSFPALSDRYRLGSAGVSPVCIGLVGDPRVVPEAFDAGVNFFFLTADMHWPMYEKLRRGLTMLFERGGGIRDDVVVAVVSYVTQPEFCHAPFEEVLQVVPGLKRVDLPVAGGAYASDLLSRLQEYRKRAPMAVGASFHDRRAGLMAMNHGLVDLAFLRYNPLHRGAEADVFPQLRREAPALLYNFKSTNGWMDDEDWAALGLSADHWRPQATDYYRYALSRPEMDGLLCALDEPAQLRALADALAEGPLTEAQLEYLQDLADLQLGRASIQPAT